MTAIEIIDTGKAVHVCTPSGSYLLTEQELESVMRRWEADHKHVLSRVRHIWSRNSAVPSIIVTVDPENILFQYGSIASDSPISLSSTVDPDALFRDLLSL
jgi:hypothetical protein